MDVCPDSRLVVGKLSALLDFLKKSDSLVCPLLPRWEVGRSVRACGMVTWPVGAKDSKGSVHDGI